MGTFVAGKAEFVNWARDIVEELLQRPEWLLDPSSKEARTAAQQARVFLKDFYDLVPGNADVPPAGALVVAGFDNDQIWEELEAQNMPIRRYLRKVLPRVLAAEKGVDVSVTLPVPGMVHSPDGKSKQATLQPSRQVGLNKAAAGPTSMSEELGKDEAASEQSEGETQREPRDFFDNDEMGQFMDLGDQGRLRLDLEAGESDFGELEGADDEGSGAEEAKTARYAEFFLRGASSKAKGKKGSMLSGRKRKRARTASSSDGEEGEDPAVVGVSGAEVRLGGEAAEDLSEEERELEEELQRLRGRRKRGAADQLPELEPDDPEKTQTQAQAQASQEEGEESLEAEDEEELAEAETLHEDEDAAEDPEEEEPGESERKGQSLYEMDRQLRALEEEVVKLEQEQLEAKPWTLQGEVSAKQRPLNSLLEVHLDQPMTHFAGRRSEDMAAALGGDAAGGDEDTALDPEGAAKKPEGVDIEAIIRQRVWDETFDDVLRKTALPPSKRAATAEDDTVETLNFEKSRVGLGEVYAQKYEAEMLGHTPEAKVKEAKEKTEAKALFAKLMHKLDLLTNAHFTPRPPMLGVSGEQLEKVASVKMEETIPLLASEAGLKAPEELRAPQRHARGREELSREERAASRRLRKTMRRRKLGQRVEAGELSLKGVKEREAHLASKNLKAKEERARQGEVRDRQKRLKASDLLAQAAENALSKANRKEDATQERKKRPSSTQSSQRLKL